MIAATPSGDDLVDWLRLIRSERVGPRTFRALVRQFGSARAALDALPDIARRAGRGGLKIATRIQAEREVEALGRLGGRFLKQSDPDYPRPLLAIDSAPPVIAVRGSAEILARPAVAIVGSRNASAAGGTIAERLAAELGRAGYAVVSGLARGIDTRAHRAGLATGTVAVLAGGHDKVYPAENAALLERIVGEGGAAVSEMPLGWEPRAQDFPRRNRLVSGLCYGTIVVEAARRSGSLITARLALEQGREVFAVPGSPLDPRAEGTNDLIRGGATLCGDARHVTEVLEPLLGRPMGNPGVAPAPDGFKPREMPPLRFEDEFWDSVLPDERALQHCASVPEPGGRDDDGERDRVLACLGASPVSVDLLARQADLPIRTVQMVLVELEVARLIERGEGGTIARRFG